jgi:hypothetical protein
LRLISPFNLGHREAKEGKTPLKVLTMNVTQFNWNDGDHPSKNMRYILDEDGDGMIIQFTAPDEATFEKIEASFIALQ